jgi:hypothetical protein
MSRVHAMTRRTGFRSSGSRLLALGALSMMQTLANAQFGGPTPVPGPARDVAPIDLTGQWVSVVTEDWRFRMVIAPKNDYPGLPLTAAAREIADAWDPAREVAQGNECKAYGVGGIMRMPGRIRIAWSDESTLEIRTDAGRQTRLLHFDDTAPEPDGAPTWQGISAAEWELHRANSRAPAVNGTLKVETTRMRSGYIRTNGVPYSQQAHIIEYFDLFTQHDGSEWLQILTIVDDPIYFTTPIITSTNFRRQSDRSGWHPEDCRVD